MSTTMASDISRAFENYMNFLTIERGLSSNTVQAYRRDLTKYVTFLHQRDRYEPHHVCESDITEFVVSLREGRVGPPLTASSTARALIAVRGMHKYWAQEGITATDVAATVTPPSTPQRLPKAISISKVELLLDAAAVGNSAAGLRDKALLEMLYGTGARISEAVGLDLDDVLDLRDYPTIRLFGKGRKERLVPVGSYAVSALEAYLVRARPVLNARSSGSSAVFLNRRGGRLSRQSAWSALKTIAQRAGLGNDVTPHTLRHSFATHLLDGGADVRVVQELLGHASVTTTQLYTLVTVDQLRQVYATSHPRAR